MLGGHRLTEGLAYKTNKYLVSLAARLERPGNESGTGTQSIVCIKRVTKKSTTADITACVEGPVGESKEDFDDRSAI